MDVVVAGQTVKGLALEEIRVNGSIGNRFSFFANPDGLTIQHYEI